MHSLPSMPLYQPIKKKILKQRLVLIFACLVFAATCCSCSNSLAQQSPWKNSGSSWRAHIIERLQHYNVPGISIAIIDSGKVVWSGGLGYRDNQKTEEANSATLFQAASLS